MGSPIARAQAPVAASLSPSPPPSLTPSPTSTLNLTDELGQNLVDSFTGTNLWLHLAAFTSTPVLIHSGIDARVYETFRHGPNPAAWPGAVVGSGAAAVGAGFWLYLDGKSRADPKSVGAALTIAQSTVITAVYVKTLKALTGRSHPTHSSSLTSQAQAEDFQFGGMKILNGYGWPSGHVSHTVAVTVGLASYYSEVTWLPWFSAGLSTYMLYTISAHDSGQMHWFSDGVAGAFMGYAIGTSVGQNLRRRVLGSTDSSSSENVSHWQWLPLGAPGYLGLQAHLRF